MLPGMLAQKYMDRSGIRSTDPRGYVSSFKTLDLVADESLAANLSFMSIF
jgi:hypothetical protein